MATVNFEALWQSGEESIIQIERRLPDAPQDVEDTVNRIANILTSIIQNNQNLNTLDRATTLVNRVRNLSTALPDSVATTLHSVELVILNKHLDSWIEEGNLDERPLKAETSDKIRECFTQQNLYLNLRSCGLTTLPPCIGMLKHLQELYLSKNQLSSLPPEIGQLRHLQILELSNNQFTQLPAEMGQLNNLRTLNLDDNHLTQFPTQIVQLNNLQTLKLCNNRLAKLPAEIGQLSNLQTLNLDDNPLAQLPAQIGQLINLQELSLNSNQLTQLPSEIGRLRNLQTLVLCYNQLAQLPPEIGQLRSLQLLHLYANQLAQLPPEIGRLRNLQLLHLDANQLAQLPPEIGQLHNLQDLHLGKNQLTSLPAEIGWLSNLELLDVEDNSQLEELPISLSLIPSYLTIKTKNTRILGRSDIEENCRHLYQAILKAEFPYRLKAWQTASYSKINLEGLLRLSQEQQGLINSWLKYLEQTTDSRTFAKEVCLMLQDIANPTPNLNLNEWRALFFTQISKNQAVNTLLTSWEQAREIALEQQLEEQSI